jgi:predicted nucleotidyltransferase
MTPTLHQIATEYKAALQTLYGHELAELVLFGSYARGEQHTESDLDFAIVLHSPFQSSTERLKTSPIASRLSLKYGLMISTLMVSLDKKQYSTQGVYQNIRKEGIRI